MLDATLACALKGMPRDALILIQTPEGLRAVVLVSGTYVANKGDLLEERPGGSGVRYAVVLHPGER